jgi:glycosyltransferase involved in cell wall biosynthesis
VHRKVSVLHVIASLDIDDGGPSRSVPNQCWSTAIAGFEVGISFVRRGEKLSPEADLLDRHKVITLPVKSLFNARSLWRSISQYDIIHVNGVWSPYCHLGAWFARLQNKPLVITIHGMLEPWALGTKKIKKFLGFQLYQKRDLEKASVLQATAVEEAKHLRALGIQTPIVVIPNGVSIPEFKGKAKKPANGRQRLLFLSRVHPKKGVLELVRAVASLRDIFERKNWFLTIAGPDEGRHWAVVEKEVQKLGVENLVEYVGSVEGKEKWDLYRSSTLFILPTYSENFGLVIAEALGCGVPVITTEGTPWEELNSHRCGWWYPIGQNELESTLRRAMTTPPQTLQEMGRRGIKLVNQKYTWPSIGLQLTETYQWILKKGPKPPFAMD